MVNVSPSIKNCPSAIWSSAATFVSRDADVFGTKNDL
jgi:hypothetical protein